jgi:hypothetical protein
VSHAAGVIWYVAPNGDDIHDCRTPTSACQTIGATVTKAGAGDQIIAATGHYTEHLTLEKSLTITGASADATILDGLKSGAVISITTPFSVTTVVTVTGFTIRNGSAGIFNEGVLSLTRSRIQDHAGRGIVNTGTATITDTLVSDNAGGGITNSTTGRATLTNVTISNNTAAMWGGGIFNTGVMTLTNVTISGNQAALGGGLYTEGPADLGEAVVAPPLVRWGTAGTASTPNVLLTNVTVSDNLGGGIMRNAFAPVGAINTIVARSTNGNCSALGVFSYGHNLSSDSSCNFTASGDRLNTEPLLGLLQDNGGATPTQAIRPGSPAIDHGDPSFCPATDQRGVARPADGDRDGSAACDIGAYELRPQVVFLPLIGTIRPGSALAIATLHAIDTW